jgi:hypothetical protein
MSAASEPLRPRDFALLMLAASDRAPRERARDQQADRAGLALKRLVLQHLVARDPEADELEGTLLAIVEELGPPTGPTRAVAIGLWEEWQTAVVTPELVAHLVAEAVQGPEEGRRRGRQLPG